MFSINTASCNSPRPATSMTSGESVSNKRIDTLPRISRCRRSRKWRLVTYVPSRPENGDELTAKLMRSTGSSTSRRGSGTGFSTLAMVSPTFTSSIPARMNKSPATMVSTSLRLMPTNCDRLEIRRFSTGCVSPSGLPSNAMVSPLRKVPACTRPMPRRPR